MLRITIREVAARRHRCPKSLLVVDIEPIKQLPLFPGDTHRDYVARRYAPGSMSLRPLAKASLSAVPGPQQDPLSLAALALDSLTQCQ